MNTSTIRKKLVAWYSGQLPAREQQELLHWLDTCSSEELEAVCLWQEYNDSEPYSLSQNELEKAYQALVAKRSAQGVSVLPLQNSRILIRVAGIAAVIAALAFLVVRITQHLPAVTTPLAYRDITVEDGQRRAVTLPDGSVITVNGGSVLSIPDQFAKDKREVYLKEGEAFFLVSKDASRPFVVHSASIHIKVVGTSFSVRDYKEEPKAGIAVRTGKVWVSKSPTSDQTAIYLLPGNKAVLDKQQAVLSKQQTDTAFITAWMRNELVFREATLQEMISVLKHTFDVEMEVTNKKLLLKKYTATFQQSSIQNIMEQLRLMGGIQYSITNNYIKIW